MLLPSLLESSELRPAVTLLPGASVETPGSRARAPIPAPFSASSLPPGLRVTVPEEGDCTKCLLGAHSSHKIY